MKPNIEHLISTLRGRRRLFLGFCPMCNSDAPELYDCPICNYYSSASGDKWPPTKETKAEWYKHYKGAIDAKLLVKRKIQEARKLKKINFVPTQVDI